MTRRQLYQHVAELLKAWRTPRRLLSACEDAMRTLRGLPADTDAGLLRDPSFVPVLEQDDALGRVYQAINAPALESAYRTARRDRRKFDDDEIPAVTQLFTPRWVVEFLIENTLGRFWKQIHPDSLIKLPWLVEGIADDPVPTPRASEIRVLDPACGTMNFGIVAIELLERMYLEELDRAGRSGWPGEPSVRSALEIGPSVARRNLCGIDIDPLALRLASATLRMKLRDAVAPTELELRRADALFDVQIEHRFAGACDVVVTNPPYLSARNLPAERVCRMKRAYPAGWRDAGTCFLQRCLQFLRDGGRTGVLAMQSFMFTGSFQPLREYLDRIAAIEAIAHFGGGLFDIGNPGTLQTAAVVLRREPVADRRRRQMVIAVRLADVADKSAALREGDRTHQIRQEEFAALPRGAWTYWLTPDVRRTFAAYPSLAEVAPPRQGLATTDNARFVRFWWELEPSHEAAPVRATSGKWFRYTKSGRSRRWYEAPRHRVDWQNDGAAIKRTIVERYPYLQGKWEWVAKNSSFYFREGVTWSYLTSGQFSARRLEPGTIFDVAGSSLFPDDPLMMLGVLNSSSARRLLGAINPTVNFQVGDLAQLPVPAEGSDELRALAGEAVEVQHALDVFDETTTDFVAPMPWEHADQLWRDLHARLAAVEASVDREAARLYGIEPETHRAIEPKPLDRLDLAWRWMSLATRQVLRAGPLRVRPADPVAVDEVRQNLARMCPSACEAIERDVGSLEAFLEGGLFRTHVRRYQRRPTIWQFTGRGRAYLVLHDHAECEAMRFILHETGGRLPDGWDRFVDDGIVVNLAPLHEWVDDPALRTHLRKVLLDLVEGRYGWSSTHSAVTSGRTCGSASAPDRRPARKAGSRGARRART